MSRLKKVLGEGGHLSLYVFLRSKETFREVSLSWWLELTGFNGAVLTWGLS